MKKYIVTTETLEIHRLHRAQIENLDDNDISEDYWKHDHNQEDVFVSDNLEEAKKAFEDHVKKASIYTAAANVGWILRYDAIELCEVTLDDEDEYEIERENLDFFIPCVEEEEE